MTFFVPVTREQSVKGRLAVCDGQAVPYHVHGLPLAVLNGIEEGKSSAPLIVGHSHIECDAQVPDLKRFVGVARLNRTDKPNWPRWEDHVPERGDRVVTWIVTHTSSRHAPQTDWDIVYAREPVCDTRVAHAHGEVVADFLVAGTKCPPLAQPLNQTEITRGNRRVEYHAAWGVVLGAGDKVAVTPGDHRHDSAIEWVLKD
jgi:hypothetical protein